LSVTARRLFDSTPFEVPVVGQGTWWIDQGDRGQAVATLRHGLDLGLTHIDTAEMYGDGTVEEIVAEAIAGRRDEVFLVSKVLPENASRRRTIAACEKSLARLRTDRLDCYLLHWRESDPLEETFEAFERLLAAGKLRSWGVSNFDENDLAEAWDLRASGGPVCNQVLYHLNERAIEHAVLPWCEHHGLALVGYSPFGHGDFPAPGSPQGRVLGQIAEAHEATPRQVALAFLVRRPSLFTIPKASSIQHVEENAGGGAIRLTRAEVARLEEAFPLGPPPDQLPAL
jgi:diketogulonate reductase-like aldo/keto reductase